MRVEVSKKINSNIENKEKITFTLQQKNTSLFFEKNLLLCFSLS